VHFKHQFVLLLQGSSPNSMLGYSTFQNLNMLMGDKLRLPIVKSNEVDHNEDGKKDLLNMEIQVPLGNTESVNIIQLLLFLDYKLHKFASLQMECMAYVSHYSPVGGAEYLVEGQLKLLQKYPLPHKGHYTKYNTPIIDSTSLNTDTYELSNIFAAYQRRNVSTDFVGRYPVWKSGRAAGSPFTVKVKVHYPEETINYRPGFWQLIKMAWIQYVAILLVFTFLMRKIKNFIYQGQVVNTVPQKVHIN